MSLSIKQKLQIRFSDTDAMAIVWHGNYLRFFEDGREEFGIQYGLEYLDMYKNGFFTPIVKSQIDHKAAIRYGDDVYLITKFIPQRAAKIVFEYEIINEKTKEVCAKGSTMQVFMNAETRELELNNPQFYLDWQLKHSINI